MTEYDRPSKQDKQDMAIELLKKNVPGRQIIDKLKEVYGSGISWRDLTKLRTQWTKKDEPRASSTVKEAFKHLYNIFLELKALKINSTPALLEYSKKAGLDLAELVTLFDEAAREVIQDQSN